MSKQILNARALYYFRKNFIHFMGKKRALKFWLDLNFNQYRMALTVYQKQTMENFISHIFNFDIKSLDYTNQLTLNDIREYFSELNFEKTYHIFQYCMLHEVEVYPIAHENLDYRRVAEYNTAKQRTFQWAVWLLII